jgi:FlaA1/EpsC-like NDP-sugar epimerase
VLIFYMLSALAGWLAVSTRGADLFEGLALLTATGLAMLILGIGLARVLVKASGTPAPDSIVRTRLGPAAGHVRQVATACIQAILVLLAFASAYSFREGSKVGLTDPDFLLALPIVFACKMGALAFFRTYRTVWRYTDSGDLLALVKASTAGSVGALAALAMMGEPLRDAKAVFLLDWVLLTSGLAAARLSLRAIAEILRPLPEGGSRVVIYGAGDTGVTLAQEIRQHHVLNRIVVGFIDDDIFKRGARIQGIPVFGDRTRLPQTLRDHRIGEVIIAMANLPAEREQYVHALCERSGVAVTRFHLTERGFSIETEVA